MANTTIHADRLVPSPAHLVHGAYEVEERFLDLAHSYLRIRGEELPIPPELNSAMMLWREMRVRHRCPGPPRGCGGTGVVIIEPRVYCKGCGKSAGDYRHTDSELKALKEIAYWTLKVNAELRNQKVPQVEL